MKIDPGLQSFRPIPQNRCQGGAGPASGTSTPGTVRPSPPIANHFPATVTVSRPLTHGPPSNGTVTDGYADRQSVPAQARGTLYPTFSSALSTPAPTPSAGRNGPQLWTVAEKVPSCQSSYPSPQRKRE